jgi:histone-lysine N-methyltransferase SETDB1
MVCHSSRDVWHDVHVNSRFFVAHYLKQFPERAMVRLQTGQKVKAELNGRWFTAVVHSVDASLVRIFFASEKIFQWIYRGSTRLHPLFEMLEIAESRRNQGASRPTHNLALINRKKNTPYVEFTFKDVDPTSPSAHLADNIYGVSIYFNLNIYI